MAAHCTSSGKPRRLRCRAETVVDLTLDRFDLSRYRTYLPQETPMTIAKGTLSGNVAVRVIDADPLTPSRRSA